VGDNIFGLSTLLLVQLGTLAKHVTGNIVTPWEGVIYWYDVRNCVERDSSSES